MSKSIANSIIGTKVYHFKEIDSTNIFASELLSKKSPKEGTVITADVQLQGKGQYGRKWLANEGENLTMSVILYPEILVQDQFILNIFSSLAVSACLQENFDIHTKVKWPNDIYVENRKITGILIQNFISGNRVKSSVIGIGININQSKFPTEASNACSIFQKTGQEVNINDFQSLLFEYLDQYYFLLKSTPSRLLKEYADKLYGINEKRQFQIGEEMVNGIIKGIDHYGRLKVDIEGTIKPYSLGEIKMIVA